MHPIIGAIGFIDAIRHRGFDLMGLIPSYVVPGLVDGMHPHRDYRIYKMQFVTAASTLMGLIPSYVVPGL
jgi:hypothetical protein